jgi:hypothetical protein
VPISETGEASEPKHSPPHTVGREAIDSLKPREHRQLPVARPTPRFKGWDRQRCPLCLGHAFGRLVPVPSQDPGEHPWIRFVAARLFSESQPTDNKTTIRSKLAPFASLIAGQGGSGGIFSASRGVPASAASCASRTCLPEAPPTAKAKLRCPRFRARLVYVSERPPQGDQLDLQCHVNATFRARQTKPPSSGARMGPNGELRRRPGDRTMI